MATGTNIRTYYQGQWHDGDALIMRAADHGSWLGTTVFDGARFAYELAPDLLHHCQRANDSAIALGITPTHSAQEIYDITVEGLKKYPSNCPVYIRPMYWALDGGHMAIIPKENTTGFCICLEEIAMPAANFALTLCKTKFHRPVLATALVNAKAGCLYPNNARMLKEAQERGFTNALVTDMMGNIAETATSNIFMVKDDKVLTPIANGTFLAGITRSRIIELLSENGYSVHETILNYDDFLSADEVFTTGNMAKVIPVTQFESTHYQEGPVARDAKRLYWEWAKKTFKPIHNS